MKCRALCGACCIAPSISSPMPGMPNGKPAGIPCIHLTSEFMCAIFEHPDRPLVCSAFSAEKEFCGTTRDEALLIMGALMED